MALAISSITAMETVSAAIATLIAVWKSRLARRTAHSVNE